MKQEKKVPLVFTLICIIIGIMIAILFQTNSSPKNTDSRNMNELRISLQKERERSQLLISEISKNDQLLYQYDTSMNKEDRVTDIMEKELKRIKKLAGFEDIIGKGFIINIEEQPLANQGDIYITPLVYDDDLRMIVNELNAYGAEAVSINEHRIIATTAIRNVGERILINTIPITPPYSIKVIGDSSMLISALKLAGVEEYFKVVNHAIEFEVKDYLRIKGYDRQIYPLYLQPVKEEKS